MALADEVIRRGLGLAELELSTAAARQEISAWTEGEFEAEAAARLQLSADIAGVSAGLSVEQTARADADAAEAAARQALAVTVGDNTAAISSEATARADADSAEAAARQALAATVGDNTTAIAAEQIVRADGDSALSATIASLSATVDGNTGAISTINATKVDAAGAVAAVDQVISAEYGGMLALAQATAFAVATINGVSSGYVWALGGEDVLSLIRIEDGVSEPVTTARLKADYIRLDGQVEVTGDFLSQSIFATSAWITSAAIANAQIDWANIQNVVITYGEITGALQSTNYAEDGSGVPTAGFRLDAATGSVKAFEVVSRTALAEGATFDLLASDDLGDYPRAGYAGDNIWTEVLAEELTPTVGGAWDVSISGEVRNWYVSQVNPNDPPPFLAYSETGAIRATRQFKKQSGDAWSTKTALTTLEVTTIEDNDWYLYNFSELFSGVFFAVRYSLEIKRREQNGGYGFAPGEKEAQINHRDMQIVITRKVK